MLKSCYITLILSNWFHTSIWASPHACIQKHNICVFSCKNIPTFGDVTINLSSLDSDVPSKPKFSNIHDVKKDYIYSWNPCKPFTQSGSCKDVNVCQKFKNDDYNAGEKPTLSYKEEDKAFYLQYSSLSTQYNSLVARHTEVKLVYEDGQDGRVSKVTEQPTNFYSLTLYTKYAPTHGGNSSGGDSGGISIGTILVIVFFCILVLYFAIGFAFLRHRGAQGKDRIPNYTFWSKLPGLIKDGCIFSFTNLKECTLSVKEKRGEKKSNEYEKI